MDNFTIGDWYYIVREDSKEIIKARLISVANIKGMTGFRSIGNEEYFEKVEYSLYRHSLGHYKSDRIFSKLQLAEKWIRDGAVRTYSLTD